MRNPRNTRALRAAASMIALLAASGTAHAQQATPVATTDPTAATQIAEAQDNGDIVVTARKRQESLLNVPVIEQVVSGADLARHQTVDLKDLTQLTPGLLIGTSVLSVGQQVSLRGVGTTSTDPGIDQSVSLIIDGLSLGQGLAYSSGMFDVGQVEVLKGPQSLFYGKSSPGGVISLRTADPTNKFEVIGTAGYETEAHTKRGELIVSGPVSDTLKARIAGMYQSTDGYYYNDAIGIPSLGGLTPRYDRMGHGNDYQVRGTVLWNPGSRFDARLKVNLVHDHVINGENYEVTYCPDGIGAPFGIPFLSPNLSCRKGRTGYVVDMNPADFLKLPNNGISYVNSTQKYGTLELNYHVDSNITATSVTGIYSLRSNSLFNASAAEAAGPLIAAVNPDFRRDDVTEELRINSDYSTPFNFTLGGFYQHGKVSDRVTILGNQAIEALFLKPGQVNPFTLAPIQDGLNRFKIDAYSVYGQLRYKIMPNLELAAGARWTDETRVQTPLLYPSLTQFGEIAAGILNPIYATQVEVVPVITPRIHSSKVSPEVTLTYKPDENLTMFASYKQGNKSGSFSIATPQALGLDNSFGDESVKGGEVGLKGRTADRQFHFDLSGFYYIYSGLQVGSVIPTVNSTPVITTINAGKAKVYGLEANGNYQPEQVKGLTINGSVAWTHARFTDLNGVPCYGGQTIAAGCNQTFTPAPAGPSTVVVNGVSGNYFAQSLTGSPLIRAPNWQANLGFEYVLPIGHHLNLTFTESNQFTSRYLTALDPLPAFYQSSFLKADMGVSLAPESHRWELAVLAKNVTAEYTAGNGSTSNTANGLLGGEYTGGNAVGPAGTDEGSSYMDPGREIWIRLTLRPFN